VPDETAVKGIGNVMTAFLRVLRGAYTGKMIVSVGDPGE
jgi:NADPH-dependent curcumin reductase CurA